MCQEIMLGLGLAWGCDILGSGDHWELGSHWTHSMSSLGALPLPLVLYSLLRFLVSLFLQGTFGAISLNPYP